MSSSSSAAKPLKKVLFTSSASTNEEGKILYTRFCKKGLECDRGDTCVFAHTYEALNPVLCAHERTKAGCTRMKECLFMHTNETKYKYVSRACREDLVRLGIDFETIVDPDSPSPVLKIGLSSLTSENGAQQIKSAYAELCEKAKHFKESWADIDEEEMKYSQSESQLRIDPEFKSMDDYNARTMYRLWGDGTLQANQGNGVFVIIEKASQSRTNVYDVLVDNEPDIAEEEDEERKDKTCRDDEDKKPRKKKTMRRTSRAAQVHHKIKS